MINQKGMEMAIQIFIVLFVLLAVSMLVLQLVSTQFTQQESKLKETQRKATFDQLMSKSTSECETLCNTGTLAKQAAYCMTNFDFSQGAVALFNTKDFTIGVCEDKIYCNMLTPCKIGATNLTIQNCKTQICDHLKNTYCVGGAESCIDAEKTKINNLVKAQMLPGNCYKNITPEQKAYHWFNIHYDQDNDAAAAIDNANLCFPVPPAP